MIYVGKESDIDVVAKSVFLELNQCISKFPTMTVILSTDLKSFWCITKLKFRNAGDGFCPYCHCTKDEIEATFRGTITPVPRFSNFGTINVPLSRFIYCFLHCKMRITETILRHQIKGYYSAASNKQKALKEWTDLLRSVTGNSGIRISIPKNAEDERKFGDVYGLTGGMVSKLVGAAKRLGQLAPLDRKTEVTQLWINWGCIIEFVETSSSLTPEFQILLKTFGTQLLDVFEWKVLTAYSHILIQHTAELITKWGNLNKYSQQGLEAANKVHKNIAKRGTNHSTSKSVEQQLMCIYRGVFLSNFD